MPTIEELTSVLSKQGGQIDAMHVVLFSICASLDKGSQAAERICHNLEVSYSQMLQTNMNQEYCSGYEKTMEFAFEILQAPPDDYKSPSDS